MSKKQQRTGHREHARRVFTATSRLAWLLGVPNRSVITVRVPGRRLPASGLAALCLISVSPFVPAAHSQPVFVPLRSFTGTSYSQGFGASVVGLGDVDGDRVPDYAVGIPGGADVGFAEVPGQVAVYSGHTSAEIRRLSLGEDFDHFGSSIAGGPDVDGDGVGDLLVGAPGAGTRGSVFLYSGASGALLSRWDGGAGDGLGSTVAFGGDLDGDGVRDVAAAAAALATVFVYSSRTGALIHQITRPGGPGTFGASIADLGDVTADGISDIAAGSPPPDCTSLGAVSVVNGTTGQIAHEIVAPPGCGAFGESLAPIPDMDSDGKRDLAIASSGDSDPTWLYVYSTGGDSLIQSVQLPDVLRSRGCSIAFVGDVQGDGTAIIAVGCPRAYTGDFYAGALGLYSVEAGGITQVIEGLTSHEELGFSVGAVGDVNGDGRQDLIFTAPGATTGSQGNVPGAVAVYGFADVIPSRVAFATGNGLVNLASSVPLDVYIQGAPGSFLPSVVFPETVRLRLVANAFRSVPSSSTAPLVVDDKDGDGTLEFLARFSKSALRQLFFFSVDAADTMSAIVEGDLRDGRRFQAPLLLTVKSPPAATARVIPNPVTRGGQLTFRTSRFGAASLRIFDLQGRLRDTVFSGDNLPQGIHDVRLGRGGAVSLPSAVYFYRLETVDGSTTGRFVLAR